MQPGFSETALKYFLGVFTLLLLALPWLLRGVQDGAEPGHLQNLAVSPKAIGEVELIDAGGNVIHTADFRGKWTLIFFGFTQCPDVCPATLMQMAQLSKSLKTSAADREYQFLFVSVDPQRDTPSRLREYVGYFDPDFLAASGEPSQIRSFEKIFGAFHRLEKRSPQDAHYNVVHSAAIFIVDSEARYVGKFMPPFDIRVVSEGLAALNAYYTRREGRA